MNPLTSDQLLSEIEHEMILLKLAQIETIKEKCLYYKNLTKLNRNNTAMVKFEIAEYDKMTTQHQDAIKARSSNLCYIDKPYHMVTFSRDFQTTMML